MNPRETPSGGLCLLTTGTMTWKEGEERMCCSPDARPKSSGLSMALQL